MTVSRVLTRSRAATTLVAGLILLAACSSGGTDDPPAAPETPGDSQGDSADAPQAGGEEPVAQTDGDEGTPDGGSAGGCSAATTEGYELFSDPAMSKHPEDGAQMGGGATLTFHYDNHDEAGAPTYGWDAAYIQDDGAVIPMTGSFFFDAEGGEFSTSDDIFISEADGRYGFLTITETKDASFEGSTITADTVELGRYCVKYVVS